MKSLLLQNEDHYWACLGCSIRKIWSVHYKNKHIAISFNATRSELKNKRLPDNQTPYNHLPHRIDDLTRIHNFKSIWNLILFVRTSHNVDSQLNNIVHRFGCTDTPTYKVIKFIEWSIFYNSVSDLNDILYRILFLILMYFFDYCLQWWHSTCLV